GFGASSPSSGIAGFAAPVSTRTNRLSSTCPGVITPPFAPPFRMASYDCNESLPSRSASLWQPVQYLVRIGVTSFLKSGDSTPEAGVAAATTSRDKLSIEAVFMLCTSRMTHVALPMVHHSIQSLY